MARIVAALVITQFCIWITASGAAELKACTATMHAEAGCSSIIPVRIHKGGQTDLLVLDQSYTTVRILDPTVVDMVSVSDRSFYLSGQDMGRTLVKFFDANGVALVGLEVTVGPPAGQVIIFNRPLLAGTTVYKCTPLGCEFGAATELQMPTQVFRNTNRNIEEAAPPQRGQ